MVYSALVMEICFYISKILSLEQRPIALSGIWIFSLKNERNVKLLVIYIRSGQSNSLTVS